MKRMSDVFDLPMKGCDVEMTMSYTSVDDDDAVANAINHVDALADALAAIVMNAEDEAFESWLDSNHPSGDVSEVQYKFEQSSEFKYFIDKFGSAQKALSAYRGKA